METSVVGLFGVFCCFFSYFKSFPQPRVSQQLKLSVFFIFPFLDTFSHACLVCSKGVWPTAVFPFMLSVPFARISMPVDTGHPPYIVLLKSILECVPPRRLLTLAIYRLKIKVNTIAFMKNTLLHYLTFICISFPSDHIIILSSFLALPSPLLFS